MSEAKRRRWLRPALVVGAVAVLAALVLVAPARRWHLVLVDVAAPPAEAPESMPRLEALQQAGLRIEWRGALPDAAAIDDLADRLTDHGWAVASFTDAAGSSSRAVTDAVLERAWGHGPAVARTAVLVRYRPSGPADMDRELGRLVDGMAAPLPPSRTLFVVIDRAERSVTLAGPPGLSAGAIPVPGEFTPWLLGVLRVVGG